MAAASSAAYCFLDIDIDDSRASFQRAVQFVEANSIKYGLSSPSLYELGGRERLAVPELYQNDYDWRGRGRCIVDPQPATRLVFELLTKESPLACENFAALCCGTKGKSKASGVELCYRGSRIHRHVPGAFFQGGDITFGTGSGGESIWGKKFKDDAGGLKLKHNRRGTLSMGNSGKNSNSSQFFVTFKDMPQCDGKHAVFGRLVHGADTLDLLEAALQSATAAAVAAASEEPALPLLVAACGQWVEGRDLAQGYWAEDGQFKPLPAAGRPEE